MKPLTATEITGTWATLLLPINDDDSIDFSRLSDEIDAIISSSASGVYSNGTAGEFYTQTEDEFDRISELLARKCEKAKLPFQIGVSHTSAQICALRAKRAAALKPAALQVILPDWFPLGDLEAQAFLERIAAIADPVGLILYNPPHAKRILSGEAMAQLAKANPGLVGAKVGNVDQAWFDVVKGISRPFSVFTPGHMLARHVPMGSTGAYSNLACLSLDGAQRWLSQLQVDRPAGDAFSARLLAFFDQWVTPQITQHRHANAAVDKMLAGAGGWANIGTRMRWPYRSIDAEIAKRVGVEARAALPELFAV